MVQNYDEHPAIKETRRLLKARKGPPDDSDTPAHKGKPARVLDGQLDLDGNVRRSDGSIEAVIDDAA